VSAPHAYDVSASEEHFAGKIITVRSDEVAMPGGGKATRDVVVHPGAVGVVALDPAGRVLLIRQYRHPVGYALWELPAGLLDVDDEPPLESAKRELFEEAALTAQRWDVLADARTSPGMTDEAIRVYLARDVAEVAEDDRHLGHNEEADLQLAWVDLDEAADRVLAGEIENAMAIVGVLSAAWARDRSWAPLRPADAPWRARPARD